MESSFGFPNVSQRLIFISGFIAPILYLVADILPGRNIAGYDFFAQSMSDLTAIDSPMRPLAIALTAIAGFFMTAFALGIWGIEGGKVATRIVAGLIMGNVVFGLVANLFFPIQFGVRPKFLTPGVLMMFTSVLCFISAIIFGAISFSGWFRLFSISIPAIYVLLAIFRYMTVSSKNAGALIGLQERTMGYSFLIWVMVFAAYLILDH